jgi:hypothetical protein
MKSGTMLRTGAGVLFTLLVIAAVPSAWGQAFTSFDPPNSGGTAPVSINPAGQIVGNYYDNIKGIPHGFLRDPNGAIFTLDAPGASDCSQYYPCGTSVSFITPQGLIVGTYYDAHNPPLAHAFLRAKDGTYTDLVVPGAYEYGQLLGNTEGAIVGSFSDSSFNTHCFLRAPSGKITSCDDILASLPNVFLVGMTAGGEILGSSLDNNFVVHAFVRSANGTITTFDAPNAAPGFFGGTSPTSINNGGVSIGSFFDSSQNGEVRYFVRAANGAITAFTPPQQGFPSPAAINSSGAIVGSVQSFDCTPGGCTFAPASFFRTASGKINVVSFPGATGTVAGAINPAGVITGLYLDANGIGHGFVGKP